MQKLGLLAFTATTCVLVPAALHGLVAGEAEIGKLAKPDADTFALGTARIGVALDRYILDPDGTLNVHVDATGATPDAKGRLALGVLVLGSTGNEGDRVPSPPVRVAHRSITLDVTEGVAKGALAIPLKGAHRTRYEPFAHYTVLVGPPAAIAKLDRLRKGARLVERDGDMPSLNSAGTAFMQAYWNLTDESVVDGEEDTTSVFRPSAIARVEAHVRPKSDAIAITIPARTTSGEAFTTTVTVKNPSRRAMNEIDVTLQEHLGFGPASYDNDVHLTFEPPTARVSLAPGQSTQLTFRVTSAATGVFGILAQANCSDEDPTCRDVEALQLGAFDATETVAPGERPPAIVSR